MQHLITQEGKVSQIVLFPETTGEIEKIFIEIDTEIRKFGQLIG